ncbi:MAG: prolyl oligopeptidase family serine peptidase [Bacteroidota bacterium]|nr:prolyl oligopeptidase family serine peptidase [Bacteroidota bacterium]
MIFKIRFFFNALICLLVVLSCQKKEGEKENIRTVQHKYPYAKKKSYTKEFHGVSLNDEYHWMEERENPEVLAYLKEENKYVDSVLHHSEALQKEIFEELKERSTPEITFFKKFNDNEYFCRRAINQLYPVSVRKSLSNNKEEIIFDFKSYIPEGQYFSLLYFQVSPDQQQIAFALKKDKEEEYSLIIRNINNELISDTIPMVSNSAEWAEDSQTIFYTTKDETGRTDKVFNHKIYLPYEEDKLEYFEEDPDFNITVSKSKNKKYILIHSESGTSSETHYLSAEDPNQDFKLFSLRNPNHKYQVFPHLNSFFILANEINNPGNKLMKAVEGATDSKHWQQAEIHNENHSIETIDVFENYLVLIKAEKGKRFIEIKDFNKNTTEKLSYEDNEGWIQPVSTTSFNDEEFQYEYESLLIPPSIYTVDLKTKQRKQEPDTELPGFNKNSFTTEKILVQAEDGTQIPLSLVYNKNIKKDNSAPVYLYGSGAKNKNSTIPAQASSVNFSNRISLLNSGFIFAFAHLRGSRDTGVNLYQIGRGLQVKDAFNDYIQCAEYLITHGYANAEKIVAVGEGLGAILQGTTVNDRPDLFGIVIVKNPKVDLLQPLEDENEYKINIKEAFGNPENEDEFNFMLTYSPYENIEVKAHPHLFIFSDFYNKEIPYYEATKWLSRLREYNTRQNTLLLKTNFKAQRSISEHLHDIALEFAFVLENFSNNLKAKQ